MRHLIKLNSDNRKVSVSSLPPRRGDTKLWAFGYADLAEFLDCPEHTVRAAVSEGRLDPSDLDSIYNYRLQRDKRQERAFDREWGIVTSSHRV